MRKILPLIILLLSSFNSFSQSPEKMSYQAIVRSSDGSLASEVTIGMRISVLKNSENGTAVYTETHSQQTNVNGLVSLEIGTGAVVSGDFTTINWSDDTYYIKTETDIEGGSNYTITGTSQLLSVPYALHAKTAGNVITYKVGDFAHGGIVFWVDETGQHGLVCSKSNQSTSSRWFGGTFGNTRSLGDGLYAGKNNTSIIIASHVFLGDDDTTYAARVSNEYQATENGKTYGGWYLPSKYELNLIYQNRAVINTTAASNSGESISANSYWSSTESSSSRAWILDMSNGQASDILKSITANSIRAVRSF